MNKKILIVSGPTATYKTSLSIKIAKELSKNYKIEIINFDSLCFYKELNIGSAKPNKEEQNNIPHHLMDITSLNNPINAHDYLQLTWPLIQKLHNMNVIPLLVGGSGFYLRALIKGMYQDQKGNTTQVDLLLKEEGMEGVRKKLLEFDPESYHSLHPQDEYRNIRALQYYFNNNKPLSLAKKEQGDPYLLEKKGYEIMHIYLDMPKEEHWPLIHQRAQKMVEDGVISEIKNLLYFGFSGQEKALQSVGNKEVVEYLKNDEKEGPLALIDKMALSTRQLAKAQRTFFKKIHPKNSYHPKQDEDKILKEVESFLIK